MAARIFILAWLRTPIGAIVTAGCLLLFSTLLFLPALNGYYVDDDFGYVFEYYGLDWTDVPQLFTGDWSRGIWGYVLAEYRPLWGLTFLANLRIWGPDPRALLATNIVLHIATGALVWLLVARLRGASLRGAYLALAFFMLSPLHAEPVAYISAGSHMLLTLFGVAAVLLLRRFEDVGGRGYYLASLVAVVAALATHELAVVLPALLVLRGLVDLPGLSRRHIVRLGVQQAPFWCLLGAYFILRKVIFGHYLGGGTQAPVWAIIGEMARAARELWLSPTASSNAPVALVVAGAIAVLFILLGPLLIDRGPALGDHAREVAYFGIAWVLLSTAPLAFGGYDNARHFALATVGLAVALGLSAARLVAARGALRHMSVGIVGGLLLVQGVSVTSNVAGFARSGELSRQLQVEVSAASARAGVDSDAVLIVIPEMRGRSLPLWQCSLPFAVYPPFQAAFPAALSPSFSAACSPEDWPGPYARTLTRATVGDGQPIQVVAWDEQLARYATRTISPAQVRSAGYTAPGGPLATTH